MNNGRKCACDQLTEDADFAKKKIIFSDEAENQHAYIEKPTHPKRVTVWCEFWSRGIIGLFVFENEQGEAVTVNGDRYRAILTKFLFTEIEEEDFGFNRTALRVTQPKLHSMFCALFLKIALSAAELMFGHLGATI